MKELSLPELKDIELGILKMFDAFCKENNIKYFLAYGTLLGAVRYKKFIPWDDDVDVLVPREDYERVIKLFQDTDQYKLFAFEKNELYLYPFAKLCDMTTKKVELGYNNGVELGVDIDIFPLDAFDDELEKAKKEANAMRKEMAHLALSKLMIPASKNPVKLLGKCAFMFFHKMIGSKHYIRKMIKEGSKKELTGSVYVGGKVWCVYGAKGVIPAEVFADTVDIEFEGQMFPAPIGWDTYLTCLYGDYLPEPPKEKQKTHHGFKAYQL